MYSVVILAPNPRKSGQIANKGFIMVDIMVDIGPS